MIVVELLEDVDTTLEEHWCPDLEHALRTVRSILECGMQPGWWVQVTPMLGTRYDDGQPQL